VSPAPDVSDAALDKLRALLAADDITLFNREEAAALREMATAWRGLAALGWLARLVRPMLWLLGLGLAIYALAKGRLGPLIGVLTGAGP
jgi:hypothetical protein